MITLHFSRDERSAESDTTLCGTTMTLKVYSAFHFAVTEQALLFHPVVVDREVLCEACLLLSVVERGE
jgi:hypothetical protein